MLTKSVTTKSYPDGYNGEVTVQIVEMNDADWTVKATMTYKGKTIRKSAKGETAHHKIDRWVNENLIRVIHAGMGLGK